MMLAALWGSLVAFKNTMSIPARSTTWNPLMASTCTSPERWKSFLSASGMPLLSPAKSPSKSPVSAGSRYSSNRPFIHLRNS